MLMKVEVIIKGNRKTLKRCIEHLREILEKQLLNFGDKREEIKEIIVMKIYDH